MKIKVIGPIIFLGLGLTGCSGATATDASICKDANKAREAYASEVYLAKDSDQISEFNLDLSQKLSEISARAPSKELADALSSDANDLSKWTDYDQFFDLARFKFVSLCLVIDPSFVAP